jgi:hypothetical protein
MRIIVTIVFLLVSFMARSDSKDRVYEDNTEFLNAIRKDDLKNKDSKPLTEAEKKQFEIKSAEIMQLFKEYVKEQFNQTKDVPNYKDYKITKKEEDLIK